MLLQGLEHLHGGGQQELETESAEDVEAGAGELGVGLVEGLIQDDERITGDGITGLGELVAQSRGQAEDNQLLTLASGEPARPFVVVHCGTVLIALDGGEGHVQPRIQALVTPGQVSLLGGGQPCHHRVEQLEARLGLLLRLIGQVQGACRDRGEICQEVCDDGQPAFGDLDAQVVAG